MKTMKMGVDALPLTLSLSKDVSGFTEFFIQALVPKCHRRHGRPLVARMNSA